MSGSGSPSLPQASFPISPPLARMRIVEPTGEFTTLGLTFFSQFWAGVQGTGGAIDQIGTINNMDGDATFDKDTGHITVFSSQGKPFVASAFVDTTDADNITSGTLDPDRIADGSLALAKIQAIAALCLLGNPGTIAGPAATISIGTNLAIAGGALEACAGEDTVATLPAAAPKWSRAFVPDASAAAFGAIVAGGGANPVPVYFDGTHWRQG